MTKSDENKPALEQAPPWGPLSKASRDEIAAEIAAEKSKYSAIFGRPLNQDRPQHTYEANPKAIIQPHSMSQDRPEPAEARFDERVEMPLGTADERKAAAEVDMINSPPHYKGPACCRNCGHPIECIDVIEHHTLVRGSAIKYLWRADQKGRTLEDLKKSRWFINREIDTIQRAL